MKKNIFVILFFILVLIATFITAQFAEAAKISGFMEDQKELYSNDFDLLIQKAIIAFNRDKTDAYVLKSPLYTLELDEATSSFDFTIKSYKTVKDNLEYYGIAFILNNVKLLGLNLELDAHKQPIIDVKVHFDPSLNIQEKDFSFSTETFVPVSDTNIGLLLFDYEMLLDKDKNYIEINKLEFSYRTTSGNETLLIIDKKDSTFIENLKLENVFFKHEINSSLIYHNNSLIKSFKSFNSYYLKYLFIEAIIVIVIAYFSFFHLEVRKIVKRKKLERKAAYENLKAQKEKEKNL